MQKDAERSASVETGNSGGKPWIPPRLDRGIDDLDDVHLRKSSISEPTSIPGAATTS